VHAVVIDAVQGDTAKLAAAAASVLGVTAFDVRPSLNVPGGGPAVIVVLGDPQQAMATAEGLGKVGFVARVVAVDGQPPRFDVREFSLAPAALEVAERSGARHAVPYASIRSLIRASPVSSKTKTKTVRETKFSPVRSVLSGGLVNTKVVQSKKTTKTTDSSELLVVYTETTPPLYFAEQELLYQGLGAQLQPSTHANFAFIVDELRRRCPTATVDERLRRRNIQGQVLGRTLAPEQYLPFAITLVATAHQQGT
jgi:hypothetical protein